MHFSHLQLRGVCFAALLLVAPWTVAEPAPASLGAAVSATWQRSPQARTLEARRDEVAAGREAAQTWMAGSPSIGLSERSDRWTGRTGRHETEISVAAPIWLPGQMSARQALAQAGSDDLDAQIVHLRLTIAGEVRERMWAVAAAREAEAEARDHQTHLEALAEDVMRRVKAGDLARTDGMLARQEVLAARAAVGATRSRVNEALAKYTILTGLADIPSPVPEAIAATAVAAPHPRMVAARAALERAQASLGVVSATRSDPPTLGLSMRREQDAFNAPSNRTIGLAVQIPFGTKARNRPLETAALTQIASTSAEMTQADAALQAEVALAQQQLTVSQEALAASSSRAELTDEHLRLIDKAFRLGERGLADVLRAQALAHEAEAAEGQHRVALGLAHARLNQAKGILP